MKEKEIHTTTIPSATVITAAVPLAHLEQKINKQIFSAVIHGPDHLGISKIDFLDKTFLAFSHVGKKKHYIVTTSKNYEKNLLIGTILEKKNLKSSI